MRWNSIRTRIMLVLLVAGILIIMVFGGIELYNARQGILNDTTVYDRQDSRYLANYVGMYMDNITSQVNIVSKSPDTIRAVNGMDVPHLKEIADNLKMDAPQTGLVSFIDNNGNILYSTYGLNIETARQYNLFELMPDANSDPVTGIYYSEILNNYTMAIFDPIKNNNTTIGGTVVLVPPQKLMNNIQAQIINPNENVLIVDHSGLLISHDDQTNLSLNTNVSSYTAVQDVLHGEDGVIIDGNTWDGQSRISAFYPVKDLGWGVIVSTPENAMYQPLQNELSIMLGMLVIFIICLALLGYYVASYMTRPIIRLSETMQVISSGNYRERAIVKRSDEIGDMAHKFNAMMDKLALAEKAREDAKEEAELYVDLLGHDINNMNQVALGYVEMALDTMKNGNCDPQFLEKTREMLFNSSALIDNVRKIQQIKAGELKPEVIDLGSLLTEMIDKYRSIQVRDLRIDFHRAGDCKVLASDLLRDVFSNLISNAIKHSTGHLMINIDLTKIQEQYRSYCMVAVSDNGPGISDENKITLFKRFMRGSTKAKGTGLGLFIVRSLVESFKGRVWVEDRIYGDYTKGCKFVVILPEFDCPQMAEK